MEEEKVKCLLCDWTGRKTELIKNRFLLSGAHVLVCPSCNRAAWEYIEGEYKYVVFTTDLGDKLFFIDGYLTVEDTEDNITIDNGLGRGDTYKLYLEMKKYYEGE